MAESNSTTARKSTSTARRKTAATRRSTTAKKAATTRATRQTRANVPTPARNPVKQAQDLAERAVLVQVGAALEARDRVVGTVSSITDTATSRPRAERQLKKFERRGASARTQLEREIRKTRTRVERELRQRRQRLERTVKRNRGKLEREVKTARRDLEKQARDLEKQARDLQKNVAANVELVAAEAQNRVQGGIKSTAKLVSDGSERAGTVS
jgi:hypothetical protein